MDGKEATEATRAPGENRLEPVENLLEQSAEQSDGDQPTPTSSAYAEFLAQCSSQGGSVWW